MNASRCTGGPYNEIVLAGVMVLAVTFGVPDSLFADEPVSSHPSLMTHAGVSGQLTVTSRVDGFASTESLRWHETLDSGWEESKRTGRPMLIFITSERCTYCDAMKQTTLSDASVLKKLVGRFVPIRLKPGANRGVLSRVKIPAYPTTLVAQPQGKVVAHRIGYQPPQAFCELLNDVALATPTKQLVQ